jgi:hypothetical protein
LREGCRIIAIPRSFELGEHYDNHQDEITSAFERRGLISVARSPDDFADALKRAREREPVRATTDPAELISYLESVLAEVRPRSKQEAL